MGKSVLVADGITRLWLYDGGVFDGGATAVLTDAEYAALPSSTLALLTLQSSPADPARPEAIDQKTVNAKGDLIAGTADNMVMPLTVGADGGVLVADSSRTQGLRYTTSLLFEGTGAPEGVVTAPVGSQYTDTAATTGAIRWIKASGSGNTGWKVSFADSGWRLVTAGLVNGWTATAMYLRRQNNTVSFNLEALVATAETSVTFYTLNLGFRPKYISRHMMSITGTSQSAAKRCDINTTGAMNVNGATTGDSNSFLLASWPTDDAWPTSLPGTAG